MPHPLSLAKYKAVIFDMDGTMINNMAYHKKSWYEFCNRHGLSLDEDSFRQKISGKKNDQIFRLLFNRELTLEEIADFTEEKESVYREIYEPDIKEVAGLRAVITQIQEKGLALAIATTAPKKNREFVLEKLGLQGIFKVILGDEDVTKGKPDPEIYLKTAEQLGVQPSECLVFEDSPPGANAGINAGMHVVGLLTSHSAEELAGTVFTITDYTELQLT
jgi:beta-phosphoglucomutase family hydrolase